MAFIGSVDSTGVLNSESSDLRVGRVGSPVTVYSYGGGDLDDFASVNDRVSPDPRRSVDSPSRTTSDLIAQGQQNRTR